MKKNYEIPLSNDIIIMKYYVQGGNTVSNVIKIENPKDYEELTSAAEALAHDELVAFPTETVYGLGANALSDEAVAKIFEAKGRPQDNPLIVHVAKKEDVAPLVKEISPSARKILDHLTPGPITIVLEKSEIVPKRVTAGGKTVAIRIPENEIARELIEKSGVPVAAPSANISGKPSPTRASHVVEDLADKVSYIIDGGACRVGLESTVIDLTVTPPAILRPGGVSHEELSELLGEVVGYKSGDSDATAPKSPGMKYRHYAPKATMMVFEGSRCRSEIEKEILTQKGKKIYVITAGEHRYSGAETINCGKNPEEYSKNLFSVLRQADSLGAEVILAEFPFQHRGIVIALANRIYKSCGGNVKLCK